MAGLKRSALLDSKLETDTRGTWVRLDHSTTDDGELLEKVSAFESLSNPAGKEAARWLREDALDNDGLTKTRLLVTDERVEGYIATCYGTVTLTGSDASRSRDDSAARPFRRSCSAGWPATPRAISRGCS